MTQYRALTATDGAPVRVLNGVRTGAFALDIVDFQTLNQRRFEVRKQVVSEVVCRIRR